VGVEVNTELGGRKDAEFATCRVLGSFEKVIQVIETYIFRSHGKGDPPRNVLHDRVVETQRELIDRGAIGISSRCKLLERLSGIVAFKEGDIVPPQQYCEVASCSPMASPSCIRIAASACWRRVLIGPVEREGVDSEFESTSISSASEVWLS
jgi:hypothetical protein